MGPCPARWRRRGGVAVLLGVLLLGSAAAAAPPRETAKPQPPDFAAVLKQTLTGRKFSRAPGPDQQAGAAMLELLARGVYRVVPLATAADLAALDHVVAAACPAVKPPSRLVKDSEPFLLTGKFDATSVPPGAAIAVSRPASARLDTAAGRFLIYSITLTGAQIAPAPIVETRGIALDGCVASGDALSLIDGATTDATISGQGLVVIDDEPVWVVTARSDSQVGLTLQPLDRRLKHYQVDDGWKFFSKP